MLISNFSNIIESLHVILQFPKINKIPNKKIKDVLPYNRKAREKKVIKNYFVECKKSRLSCLRNLIYNRDFLHLSKIHPFSYCKRNDSEQAYGKAGNINNNNFKHLCTRKKDGNKTQIFWEKNEKLYIFFKEENCIINLSMSSKDFFLFPFCVFQFLLVAIKIYIF